MVSLWNGCDSKNFSGAQPPDLSIPLPAKVFNTAAHILSFTNIHKDGSTLMDIYKAAKKDSSVTSGRTWLNVRKSKGYNIKNVLAVTLTLKTPLL